MVTIITAAITKMTVAGTESVVLQLGIAIMMSFNFLHGKTSIGAHAGSNASKLTDCQRTN